MSTRLQVVLSDEEAASLREMAVREGTTVADVVRRSLREARRRQASGQVDKKLAAIRTAVAHEFPAPDVEQMLDEIERGYLG